MKQIEINAIEAISCTLKNFGYFKLCQLETERTEHRTETVKRIHLCDDLDGDDDAKMLRC